MKRVLSALVLIPIVVWAVVSGPLWALMAVMAAVGLLALHEFDSMVAAHRIAPAGYPGMAAALLFLVSPEPMATAVLLALFFMTLALRLRDLAAGMASAAAGLLGVIYIFGAWRCAILLRAVNPHWLMLALLASWAGDTAALYVGRAFGRNKMAPRISPSKTWEGAAGSLLGGIAGAAVYAYLFLEFEPLWRVILVAACANVAGQAGDLCESALKRGAGMKDSGTLLPGHGGWLDRIDSSLFSIPVTYLLVRFTGGTGFSL